MYQSGMNHYLLRQDSGEQTHFFHKKKEGLCVRIRKDQHRWSPADTIQSEVHGNFCVTCHPGHNPFILCQNWYGDLLLLQRKNRQWGIRTVLKSLTRYNKKPFLVSFSQGLLMFFRKIQDGRSFLLCQRIDHGETENNPVTLDEIGETGKIYRVVTHHDSLVAFYTKRRLDRLQPGYRIYHTDTGKWDDFTPVTGMKNHSGIIDSYDDGTSIHTLWRYGGAEKVQLLYARFDISTDTWQQPKVLLELEDPIQTCSMLSCHESLICCWILQNTIYFRLSVDNGETWSGLETYPFANGEDYYTIHYQENNAAGYRNTFTVPGIFNDGYQLAFIDSGQPGEVNKQNGLSGRLLEARRMPDQISGLKQGLDELEAKYHALAEKLRQVEEAFQKQKSQSMELEKGLPERTPAPAGTAKKGMPGLAAHDGNSATIPDHEKPLMTGAGFSNITLRYLKESNGEL